MFSNSFKFVALGLTIAGLVACGKGTAEKNRLKIGGTYQKKNAGNATQADSETIQQGKLFPSNTSLEQLLTLVEIDDDNLRTTYIFSKDRKSVEIIKERLIIQGKKIIGIEDIKNPCIDQNDLGVHPVSISIDKLDTNVTMRGDEKGNFIAASADQTELLKSAKAGELEIVCFNEKGQIVAKVEAHVAEEATTKEEDAEKTKEESQEQDAQDEKSSGEGSAKVEESKYQHSDLVIDPAEIEAATKARQDANKDLVIDSSEIDAATKSKAAVKSKADASANIKSGVNLRGQTVVP